MSRLARISQSVKSWVYPPLCAGCDVPLTTDRQLSSPFLCRDCEDRLEPIGDNYCRICGQSYEGRTPSRFGCVNCGGRGLVFDFSISAYRSSGMARELMHAFKYGKRIPLSRLMGNLMTKVWQDERLHERSLWLVVPVPLHSRRIRERGFNQSHEIAQEFIRRSRTIVGGKIELQLFPALKRVTHSVRQAQLDRKERLTNLANAYACKRSLRFPEKNDFGVLIVDDVITTATTISECAATMRSQAEISTIAGISVLRG